MVFFYFEQLFYKQTNFDLRHTFEHRATHTSILLSPLFIHQAFFLVLLKQTILQDRKFYQLSTKLTLASINGCQTRSLSASLSVLRTCCHPPPHINLSSAAYCSLTYHLVPVGEIIFSVLNEYQTNN